MVDVRKAAGDTLEYHKVSLEHCGEWFPFWQFSIFLMKMRKILQDMFGTQSHMKWFSRRLKFFFGMN